LLAQRVSMVRVLLWFLLSSGSESHPDSDGLTAFEGVGVPGEWKVQIPFHAKPTQQKERFLFGNFPRLCEAAGRPITGPLTPQ
jgi:hypothetical protein